jgi:PII-like signaling protein
VKSIPWTILVFRNSEFDSEEKIQKLIPFLDEVVDQGLVAMSEVEVIKYEHQEGARSQ